MSTPQRAPPRWFAWSTPSRTPTMSSRLHVGGDDGDADHEDQRRGSRSARASRGDARVEQGDADEEAEPQLDDPQLRRARRSARSPPGGTSRGSSCPARHAARGGCARPAAAPRRRSARPARAARARASRTTERLSTREQLVDALPHGLERAAAREALDDLLDRLARRLLPAARSGCRAASRGRSGCRRRCSTTNAVALPLWARSEPRISRPLSPYRSRMSSWIWNRSPSGRNASPSCAASSGERPAISAAPSMRQREQRATSCPRRTRRSSPTPACPAASRPQLGGLTLDHLRAPPGDTDLGEPPAQRVAHRDSIRWRGS